MGLDLVEYVLAVEDAFQISLPDEDLAALDTPRKLVEYLVPRLNQAADGAPLLQRAFYRVRQAIADTTDIDRRALKPGTVVAKLLPDADTEALWKQIRAQLGVGDGLPLRAPSWWRNLLGSPPTTLGSVAADLVAYHPTALKHPGEGWTPQQIADVVTGLLEAELAVDMSKYTLDSRFTHDMNLD